MTHPHRRDDAPSLTALLDDMLPLVRWFADQTPGELIEARLRDHKARMITLTREQND